MKQEGKYATLVRLQGGETQKKKKRKNSTLEGNKHARIPTR
jgi:hypothetical protein